MGWVGRGGGGGIMNALIAMTTLNSVGTLS